MVLLMERIILLGGIKYLKEILVHLLNLLCARNHLPYHFITPVENCFSLTCCGHFGIYFIMSKCKSSHIAPILKTS